MQKKTRSPQPRMLCIHQHLYDGDFPNCSSLARELEVSTKTIGRDIDYMRDQMGMPIEWDAAENGYFYTEAVGSFPTVQISEGELFALLVAQRALEPYQNTPFEKPLANVFQKISDGLRDKVSIALDQMDGSISFKATGLSNADLETFQLVTRAVATEQEMEFEYKGYSDTRFKKRRIQPWHLCCVDNQWYVIGHDLMRKAKRTFLLVRMRKIGLTGEPFDRPRDFNLQEHLRDSFGVFAGKDLQRVRIEFKGQAARLVQEKTWHPTQEIKDLGGGRIEYTVRLGDLYEIERWVLGWGGEARVLSPAKLKNRIRKHAEKILYG